MTVSFPFTLLKYNLFLRQNLIKVRIAVFVRQQHITSKKDRLQRILSLKQTPAFASCHFTISWWLSQRFKISTCWNTLILFWMVTKDSVKFETHSNKWTQLDKKWIEEQSNLLLVLVILIFYGCGLCRHSPFCCMSCYFSKYHHK